MFRPKNFYSVLTSMYYTTKIFGLTPFQVQNEGFKRSKLNMLWSVVLMIFLNIYTSIGLNSRPELTGEKFIARVTDTTAAYLTQFNLCFGILFECVFLNKILTAIKDINTFDMKSHLSFGVDLLKEYRKSKIYITISLTITVIYVILVVNLTALPTKPTLTYLGEFMAYVTPEIINSFIEFQFCTLILSVKQRFSWLNRRIIFVTENLGSNLREYDDIFCVSSKANRISPATPIVAKGFMQDRAIKVIEKLRRKHYHLCSICKSINNAYSVQILLIVLTTFTTIIVLLYYAGRHILLDPYLPLDYLLYCFGQISLALIQLGVLVKVCSNTSMEARRAGVLIHNVISVQQQYKFKEDLQLGITTFSLQLLHQNVEFTACKMFVINETLLFSIIGAITTYLVIVIQFEMADIRKSQ